MNTKEQNTYDRILNAGVRLFAQKGFAATTTREIVNEAGASLSSLQQYFGSKEKIYIDAVQRSMKRYAARMEEEVQTAERYESLGMLHGTTAWDTLSGIINKHCDWVFDKEEIEAINLMNREMLDPHPRMHVPQESLRVMDTMAKLADAYVGTKDTIWAKLMAHNIIMQLFGIANYPRVVSEVIREDVSEENVRQNVRLILNDFLLTTIRAYLDTRKRDHEPGQKEKS